MTPYNNVTRLTPAGPMPPPSEPMAVARRIVADGFTHPGGVETLRRWRGGWMRWDSTHWSEVDDAGIRASVYKLLEHAEYVDSKGELVAWSPSSYRVRNVLEALAAVAHLPEHVAAPSWLVDSPHRDHTLVVARNGMFCVEDRELLAADPAYFTTGAVPFDFTPEATAPRWEAFLDELWPDDPDAIAVLQEWFGYVLSGRTSLHKVLLLIGPTRSGKGTIARILAALVGEGNVAGPTLASLGSNFGLQPLIGKTLAVVSDARLGRANTPQIVERLLSISGEDALTVDRKYRDPWTGTLGARFTILSNELPRFGDASGAIAGRMTILAMTASWLGKENPDLTKELKAELDGILNWALVGLDRLTQQGRFTEPESSRDAATALGDLASPVSAFVRDRCTLGVAASVEKQALFDAWRAWCDEQGHRASSASVFARDLMAAYPAVRSSRPDVEGRRVNTFTGISLTTPDGNGSVRGRQGSPPIVVSQSEDHLRDNGVAFEEVAP